MPGSTSCQMEPMPLLLRRCYSTNPNPNRKTTINTMRRTRTELSVGSLEWRFGPGCGSQKNKVGAEVPMGLETVEIGAWELWHSSRDFPGRQLGYPKALVAARSDQWFWVSWREQKVGECQTEIDIFRQLNLALVWRVLEERTWKGDQN